MIPDGRLILLTCLVIASGCELRPSSLVADYGTFSFTEKAEEGWRYFGLRVSTDVKHSPSFEFKLDDGSIFSADTLTMESARTLFSKSADFERNTYDRAIPCTMLEQGPVSVTFVEGSLESVNLSDGGKLRPAGRSEFLTLPIADTELKQVFGEPIRYGRAYGSNP